MTKLETLDIDFRVKISELMQHAAAATGRMWVVTAGRRTMAEQRAIYAQGRTKPGKVVSNAPAGSSAHNYGLAADLAPLCADGKTIDWNAPRAVWQQMADIAVAMGLTAGFYFHSIFDAPHIEDSNWKIQQAAYKAGKLDIA
jgi:peptidoglycan L-alanyl-D-glutamate endopeptidase CwlK